MRIRSIIFCVAALLLSGSVAQSGTIEGKITAKRAKYLPQTVVYLGGVKGDFKPPEKHAEMDQKNLVFKPHILPILAGTTVDFVNSDDVAHNVFTPDETAGKFNLGTWPTGQKRSYTFEKTCDSVCSAVMLCNVHPEMEAFVVMMTNPYFTMADKEGSFTIEDVPAGTYTLNVWNPKQKSDAQSIEVPAEGTVEATLELHK